MDYQCGYDQILFENAKLANENAKLAIQKWGQVVSCLAHLSHVLQTGLNVKSTTLVHCVHRKRPPHNDICISTQSNSMPPNVVAAIPHPTSPTANGDNATLWRHYKK